ncbi:MAG TPA: PHP domain-containing protein [Candidatus Sulfotelmatobacter sp.]|nr:PHP domain-containing protein [Candidatus Sulfotelmatobacter sp.]
MKFADLHLHTNFSDGTWTPEELVLQAQKSGLSCIAVTDHDTVEGCERAAAACAAVKMEFIPGAELTAEHEDTELHVLGYYLDIHNEKLLAEIARFQVVRQNRIYEMVARINDLGVPLKAESVFALANCKSPGRPHVARAMVKDGHVKNLDEAFERFLKKGRPAWVPKSKISALDAIELVHQAGGVAVMAHPGLNRTDSVIPALVAAGLDGIECFHTKHSTAISERYLEIADKYNLLVTGGSDCHGYSKGKPLIGTVKLPYEHIQKMKEHRAKATTLPSAAAR